MSLFVKDERLTSPIQPATHIDRLRADGWEKHEACEGTGIENNCRWANEGWANEGLGHECDGCTCPDCAYGLIPPRFRSEAAARWVHREMGRRSGVGLTWEAAYPEEQADYLRLAGRMLVEAARAEATDE